MIRKKISGYLFAVFGIVAVTVLLEPFHLRISATTVALTLLMVVLFTATIWGSRPAFIASILGVLFFNYFFLPPTGTWTVTDPENWFALTAFLFTALTAGQLSSRAKRRAEEAESRRVEIERLYKELNEAFEKASHAEALKRSEKLKSALLDAVTHDIRTPLTSIKASVTTLLNEGERNTEDGSAFSLDAETRRDMLEVINEESDRLNNFAEGLIELAKIEAGEMRLLRQWNTIDEIIKSVVRRAESLVRHHEIIVNIEGNLPAVSVDSRAVGEVIYTLIDNAAKYSPLGTSIEITARRKSGAAVMIAVKDEGRGIPLELRRRVFDKFFRATRDADVNTSQPPGTGMGLAIAKGIVEAHGGEIWIEDAERGSNFTFTLPVESDTETPCKQIEEKAPFEKNI